MPDPNPLWRPLSRRSGQRAALIGKRRRMSFSDVLTRVEQMTRRRFFPSLRRRGNETDDVLDEAVRHFLTNLREKHGWDRIVTESDFFNRAACYISWAMRNVAKGAKKGVPSGTPARRAAGGLDGHCRR